MLSRLQFVSHGVVSIAALFAVAFLLTGCSTDKHQSLYSQMLDCEQQYANLLARATDVESVKQSRPQMSAEEKQYRDLGKQFLNVERLNVEKLRGILDRSASRQRAINDQIKEQM